MYSVYWELATRAFSGERKIQRHCILFWRELQVNRGPNSINTSLENKLPKCFEREVTGNEHKSWDKLVTEGAELQQLTNLLKIWAISIFSVLPFLKMHEKYNEI